MRGVLIAVTLAATAMPSSAFAQSAPTGEQFALAKEVVTMILPEDRRETMMRAIMTSTNASMKDGIDKMLAGQKLNEKQRSILSGFMERYTQQSQDVVITFLPELLDAMAKAYARQFSMQQLNDLKAFFSTPTGKIYMEKSPAIMADPDVAAVQSRMMQMTMGRLPAAMKEMADEMKQAGLAKE